MGNYGTGICIAVSIDTEYYYVAMWPRRVYLRYGEHDEEKPKCCVRIFRQRSCTLNKGSLLVHFLQNAVCSTTVASGSVSNSFESSLQMMLKHWMKWRFALIESNYTLAAPIILDSGFKKVAFIV